MILLSSAKTCGDYNPEEKYEYGFFGGAIDDRTDYSVDYVKNNTLNSICIRYDYEKLCLFVGEKRIECHEFSDFISKFGSIRFLIDSTSIGVPELSLLIKSFYVNKRESIFFYVEPSDYNSSREEISCVEEFYLSSQIMGFEAAGIPTMSKPVDNDRERRFVFFLGFEESRLLNALEVYDIKEDEAKIVFGIPAFQPGWEARSIRRNMKALTDFNMHERIGYCGANSAESTLRILRKFHSNHMDLDINLVPIGTKPNALGALFFLAECENANLLFDQPLKKKGRTNGIGEKHFYKALIS